MRPNLILAGIAALAIAGTAGPAQAQRPNVPRTMQRAPATAQHGRPPPRSDLDALRNRVRTMPRIPPLSPQARLARVRALLADQNVTLSTTSTTLSSGSPLDQGAGLSITDASSVYLPDGAVFIEGRDVGIDYRFPDGFHGRYVFDCVVNAVTSISWWHAGLQAQVPVSDGHALFVVDVDPEYWLMITIPSPASGSAIWRRCDMTAVQ